MGLSTSKEKKNWGKCAGGCGRKAIILVKEKKGERTFMCFRCLTKQ